MSKISWHDEGPEDQRAGELERAVHEDDERVRVLGSLMNSPRKPSTTRRGEFWTRTSTAGFRRRAGGDLSAAAGLCNWCLAMKTYHFVAKVVEPDRGMRVAEADLKVAMKEKNDAEEVMAGVQAKLDEMQAKFDGDGGEAAAGEDAAATQRKMDGATALINALASNPWTGSPSSSTC